MTSFAAGNIHPSSSGKVREIFDFEDRLLLVATDRLSAFDVILPDGIPGKGTVLTRISEFWFRKFAPTVPHHLLSTRVKDFPHPFSGMGDQLEGRSMLVKKTTPILVECVVRGFLAGSAWNEYRRSQAVCGIQLLGGLKESDRLPKPIFTPTTKAERGNHDENISFDDVVRIVGGGIAENLRTLSVNLYVEAAAYAETRGIIIADTKFEFGLDPDGVLCWIDEAITPDSSRFWPKDSYAPGGPQQSFDKQFVRDYLISINWNKQPPAPALPAEVIETTSRKYREALFLLTGETVD